MHYLFILLLAPSQLDLLPTLRSRSLALFLGASPRPRSDAIDGLAGEFGEAIAAYRESGNKAELFAASAVLKQAGTWKDPRARGPWETASAVVVGAARSLPESAGERRALLALAADLLDGPTMRLRGIQPDRIIEGLLSARIE